MSKDQLERFDDFLDRLEAFRREVEEHLPDSAKMVVSADILNPVVVGQSHRVTLSEFPVGTVLMRKHIMRRGEIAGIELVIM